MGETCKLTVKIRDDGTGLPVVILPGMFGIESREPVCDAIFSGRRILTFTHPGYSGTHRPIWCEAVAELAYAYMDEIEARGLSDVTLVGFSLGGWVACEMAVHRPKWLSRLLLVDSLGVRAGGRTDRTHADVFAKTFQRVRDEAFHDRESGQRYLPNGTDEERLDIAYGQEALAAYGWKPYLHDKSLPRRLRRVAVQTMVLWGADDRIADIGNGKFLAQSIPGAVFDVIPAAGHQPHLDNPTQFKDRVGQFLREGAGAASAGVAEKEMAQ